MYEIVRMGITLALLALLGVMAFKDWKTKEVPVIYLIVSGAVAALEMVYLLAAGQMLQFRLGISGLLLGVGCTFISYRTKEKIGYADSVAIGIVGTHLGIWRMIGVLLLSFFCVFVRVVLKEGLHKDSLKKSMPFLPFSFLGYLGAGVI